LVDTKKKLIALTTGFSQWNGKEKKELTVSTVSKCK